MLKAREFNNFQWHDLVASGVVEYIGKIFSNLFLSKNLLQDFKANFVI